MSISYAKKIRAKLTETFRTTDFYGKRKLIFLYFILIMGMLTSFTSGMSYLREMEFRIFFGSVTTTVVCLICLILLRMTGRERLVSRILVYYLLLLILYMVSTHRLILHTPLLLYILPPVALFLLGLAEGSIVIFLMGAYISTHLFHNYVTSVTETHKEAVSKVLMTYGSIYLLTLIYEIIRGMSQRNLNDKRRELEKVVERMNHTQTKLAETNDYLYKIYNLIPSAIYTVDENMKITSINKMALKILGYTEKELIGEDCRKFADKPCRETCAMMNPEIKKPLLGRICTIVTKEGDRRIISKNADNLYDGEGRVVGGVESFEDITEKHRKDEEIKKLSYAVSQSPASIVMTDIEGNIEYVNPKFTEVSGYSYEEAIGQNPRILKSGDKSKEDYKNLWDTITSGKDWRGEFHNKRKDGSLYWEMALIAPIRDENNEVKHFVAVKEDITSKKRMESELMHAKEKAESATKAKSEFLANMSHEIRTPMNGIIGMTELLMATTLDEEQTDYVKIVKQSSITLLTLINDILDFSKIESGKMVFEEVEFDLYELLNVALKPIQMEASRKKLELILDIDREVPRFIKSDPTRLKQILLNLAGNAIKFTSKGEILVKTSLNRKTPDYSELRIDVEDTGIGIDREKLDKIFEPFEQADSSTTRNFGGTGLGTTISKYIAEKLGGSIKAESPSSLPKNYGRGPGSCFTFTFMAKESGMKCPMDEKIPDFEKHRFVIIDDNPINLRILKKNLENWSIKSDGFLSVEDAVDIIRTKKTSYTFALIDYNLTGMNGLEAADLIRREIPGISVIMLSSSFSREETEMCRREGVGHCLSKPVTQSTLYDSIVSSLEHKTILKDKGEDERIGKANGISLSILVAEDNLVNQKVARFVIEKMGHKVTIASNGNEVLQKMSVEFFDMILMDIQMPEMDGLTATKIIREYEQDMNAGRQNPYLLKIKSGRIPIVALTAHAMKEDRDLCIANGMDDYVSKPLQVSELKRVFDKAKERGV